jgi:hypothetical protein
MPRRNTWTFVVFIGLAVLLGASPGLVAAQQLQFGDGITVTPGTVIDDLYQEFDITFDHGAYIPEKEALPEAMVVKVRKGLFAFRAGGDVVVDPQGKDIFILKSDTPFDPGADPGSQDFTSDGSTITDCVGTAPHILCVLKPDVFQDNQTFAQLEEGFTVYLPDPTICFFCNTLGIKDDAGNPADEADLLVLAPPGSIGWSGTERASGPSGSRAWLLDPGSPCH